MYAHTYTQQGLPPTGACVGRAKRRKAEKKRAYERKILKHGAYEFPVLARRRQPILHNCHGDIPGLRGRPPKTILGEIKPLGEGWREED